MEFIELCRQFIQIDTSPSHGTGEAGLFLTELCRNSGFDVEAQEETWLDQPQMNVLARPRNFRGTEQFLLQTHIDTPDPGPFGLWIETGLNPFDAHIKDGKIFGLGAADSKLDILCKIEALKRVGVDKDFRVQPVLLATYGEQLGMQGALRMIRKDKIKAKRAFIGAPTDSRIIVSSKGMAQVRVVFPFSEDEMKFKMDHNLRESTSSQNRIFHGKSAHSSNPALGDSAIKKMLDYLMMLPESVSVLEIDGGVNFNTVPANAFLDIDPGFGFKDPIIKKISKVYREINKLESEFLLYEDTGYSPPHPTWNIGIIRTYDDHVVLEGTCRFPSSVPQEVYESWMNRLSHVCISAGCSFKVVDYKRPFSVPFESEFLKESLRIANQIGISSEVKKLSSTNEASLFSRVGVECLCFGPGHSENNIHTPGEHVRIESLEKAIQFYTEAIKRFCL